MYLIIAEDGVIRKTKEVSKEWMNEAEDGNIDIIDISDHGRILWYYQDGEWTEVETL